MRCWPGCPKSSGGSGSARSSPGWPVEAVARLSAAATIAPEPEPRDIVFEGELHEVNRLFHENEWSDGLPIVPPTVAQVQRFLRCTDRGAGEVMGVILPDNRAASVWSVAVNVTGGLTEIASVMGSAVSNFGIVHSGKAAVLLAPATARQLAADG